MNKIVYNILSFIENVVAMVSALFCLCYAIGEPIGDYTFKIFIFKILAIVGFFIICKFELD